jgi:hypothetical protein
MSSAGGKSPLYESEETVPQMARQLIALGIPELVLPYPRLDRDVRTFERIARDVLPALRPAT